MDAVIKNTVLEIKETTTALFQELQERRHYFRGEKTTTHTRFCV
jgi:hypothetical protein